MRTSTLSEGLLPFAKSKPVAPRKSPGLQPGAIRKDPKSRAKEDHAAPVPGLAAHEQAVIGAALAILGSKLREQSVMLDGATKVKDFLRLHLTNREVEAFVVIFLDAQNRLIACDVVSEGTLTQTSVYPREIVKRALRHNAAGVILSHNHPSGVAEPSRADQFLTQTLKVALSMIDVRVLDHMIVGGLDICSLAEQGRM